MNVYTFGLNDGFVRMAARYVALPSLLVGKSDRVPTHPVILAQNLGGDRGWRINAYLRPPAEYPHFPYGNIVDPDEH